MRNLFSTLFYFILVSNEMTIIYLQGERDDEDFPFLDDEGIELKYFNWDEKDKGNYPRTDYDTKHMEASGGTFRYRYICQIY